MSVRPSSSTSMGPLTVSTVGMRGLLPVANPGRKPTCGMWLRASGVPRPLAALAAGVEHGAEKDPADRDNESDDHPEHPGAVNPLLNRGTKCEDERKQDGKPLPLADGGVAKADARDEEEEIGDHPHGRIIPAAVKGQSRARAKRGSQDSNPEPPGLETGTLPVSYCPSRLDSRCQSRKAMRPV